MRRRRTAALALLLLAGALWLLFAGAGDPDPTPIGDEREEAAEGPPSPLQAEAGASAEPALAAGGSDASEGPARGPVRVRVLGADGDPVAFAFVAATVPGPDGHGSGLWTGPGGVAEFPDLPYDGRAWLDFYRRDPRVDERNTVYLPLEPLEGTANRVHVRGPEVVYRAGSGLWLDVHVIDAESGTPLENVRVRETEVRDGKAPWRDAPGPIRIMAKPARPVVQHFQLGHVKGYVLYDVVDGRTPISPYARRLTCLQPLRKEMDVTITAVDGASQPVQATVQEVRVGGRVLPTWRTWTDAYERLRLGGVPFLRGELLQVFVRRASDLEEGGGTLAETLIPDDSDRRIELRVLVPPDVSIEDHNESSSGMGGSPRSGRPGRRAPKYANEVLVHVRRRAGDPAIGALVEVGGKEATTDGEGLARFSDLAPGTHPVRVRQVGLLPIEGTVRVSEEGSVRAELREGNGGTIHLEVADDEGAALAFARFRVGTPSKLPWLDLDGATQRIDMLVDHLGERTLRNVEPGKITIRADWGSRSVRKTIDVVEGGATTLRLQMRRRIRLR